jgi:hypothetical protein
LPSVPGAKVKVELRLVKPIYQLFLTTTLFKGICPKCKRRHYGPALNQPRNQLCVKCGSVLDIRKGGIVVRRVNMLGTKAYKINLEIDIWEQMRQKVIFF